MTQSAPGGFRQARAGPAHQGYQYFNRQNRGRCASARRTISASASTEVGPSSAGGCAQIMLPGGGATVAMRAQRERTGRTNNTNTVAVSTKLYTIYPLRNDFTTQMNDGETNVTITYDRITNKYNFAIGPATRSVTIHGATSSDLTQVIGLTTEDFTFDNTTARVTPNALDMNGGIHALYLRTNLPVLSSMDSQTGGLSQILAKVPILDKPGSVITHEPANAVYKALIQTEAVRAITLRLTDDRNSLISLNGLHFSVSLMFEFVSLAHKERPQSVSGSRMVTDLQGKETPKKEKKKNEFNRIHMNPPVFVSGLTP
eukprot:SAG22_NODE_3051_length_1980_cov_3.110993_2_plen_315_part_00